MKAISLWQPWASLWLSGRKVHETRHWPTRVRGPILVHAARRFEKDFDPIFASLLRAEFGSAWFKDLPRGVLIGVVTLVDCLRTETVFPTEQWQNDDFQCGDFTHGRFAWRRGDYRVFKTPIPWKGSQGFFDVPDEIVSRAHAA